MRKIIVFSMLLFLSGLVFGQLKNEDQIASVQVCYGYKTLNQNFDNNLNTFSNFGLKKPLQTIGLLYNGQFHYGARGHFSSTYYYNQIIPQAVLINGVYKCNVTGFNFGVGYGGDLFKKAKNFDLILNAGFNTGRLRLYGNELTRQKNPYFAPKIGLRPTVKLGKLAISLTIEYDYDVSKPSWRKTFNASSTKANISQLQQTGLTTFIGIGYSIF